ncbi:MAG: hypothetical protein HYR84_07005 [Planctomycetes bacterium]|nr:hypothetical protein [Planctomycetota bacterium]
MIPNPILKVLSTLTTRRVRHLLMGGQACVLYGGAQFSRDTDVVIAIDPANLAALQEALDDLQAKQIAVPPFEIDYLRRGMAVHFRCQHPDAKGIRLDVMHVMRGVAPFEELWSRRTTLEYESGLQVDMLALPDLVLAKKTQRDKDWPMIRVLVEAHYRLHNASPNDDQVRFWLQEARTPAILQAVAKLYPALLAEVLSKRPLLADVASTSVETIDQALQAEERLEREADRQYWAPLFKELEQIRHRK